MHINKSTFPLFLFVLTCISVKKILYFFMIIYPHRGINILQSGYNMKRRANQQMELPVYLGMSISNGVGSTELKFRIRVNCTIVESFADICYLWNCNIKLIASCCNTFICGIRSCDSQFKIHCRPLISIFLKLVFRSPSPQKKITLGEISVFGFSGKG